MEVTTGLDPVIHPLNRLRICALLSAAREVEFGTVRRGLDMSPSSLSKQLAHLVSEEYVEQRRSRTDSRRVWLSLTPLGRSRYEAHMEALRGLAGEPAGTPSSSSGSTGRSSAS